jgi:hypothetical protein
MTGVFPPGILDLVKAHAQSGLGALRGQCFFQVFG